MLSCRFLKSAFFLTLFLPIFSFALEVGVGGNYSRFSYKELVSPSDSENGYLASWIADLRTDLSSSLQLELRYSSGDFQSNYSGFVLNTGAPAIATDPMKIVDAETLLNYNLDNTWHLFSGAGFHSWDREVGGAPGNPDEVYSWLYIPVGVEYAFSLEPNQEIRIHLEAQQMLNSTLKGSFVGQSDVNVNLGSKLNYLLKVPIRWNPGSSFYVETTPWFEYSSIGQSNTVAVSSSISSSGYLVEPNSTAVQYGLEVMFFYKF